MNDPDPDRRQAIALFRYGVIAELLQLPPGGTGLYRQLADKAARDYSIPGSTRTRIAAETIRDWLQAYRRGGFDALLPKPRVSAQIISPLNSHAFSRLFWRHFPW